ncbi:hypothetical protein FRC11_008343 [Ceratobasidium sp. 423]|nr:hypothetical protein FRC11_008343 [Ceratobasidium sp. 423]
MIAKSDSVLSQLPLGEYYAQSASVDQQNQGWGHLPSTEPLGALAFPTVEPTFQQGFAPFDGGELGLEQFGNGVNWTFDPQLAQAQPVVDISQAPFLPVIPQLQTPMIVSPQPVLAPQATPAAQPIPVPQPPQPVSQPVFKHAPAPQEPLGSSAAMAAAIEAKETLMTFRLYQVHKPSSLNDRRSVLLYSKLGLEQGKEEEYQAIVEGGIPLFVLQTTDWDRAMGLLGETAFHLFRREELEKADREGQILPPMENKLAFYVHYFPLTEELEHCLNQLQGAVGGDL